LQLKPANLKLDGLQPQIAADRQYSTRRAELGNYHPRRFGARSRLRFDRARRRDYLARFGKPPSAWQSSTIASLVALEWSALSAEAQIGNMIAAREAREHRRLFQRLLAEFERSLQPTNTQRVDPMECRCRAPHFETAVRRARPRRPP
jgi:hypothetical protein